MIYHVEMVARAAKRAMAMADMPFLSYQTSTEQAILAAAGGSSRKPSAGPSSSKGAAVGRDDPGPGRGGYPDHGTCRAHPQSVRRLGGFKVQRNAEEILADAHAVAEAGAFALVLECVPSEVAARVTAELAIPTIGIGAGAGCDGQVLVSPDPLGMFEGSGPGSRRYAELGDAIRKAAAQFVADVGSGDFPNTQESFQ